MGILFLTANQKKTDIICREIQYLKVNRFVNKNMASGSLPIWLQKFGR